MANIINISDFTGVFELPINTINEATIQSVIDYNEPEILKTFLGFDLYNQFVLGLAEVTPLQKWIDLRDGKNYVENGITKEFNGLKAMLKGFLWYYSYKELCTQKTNMGTSFPQNEVSETNPQNAKSDLRKYYNIGVKEQNLSHLFIEFSNSVTETYTNYEPTLKSSLNIFDI